MPSDPIEPFAQAVAAAPQRFRDLTKNTGQRCIGYFCTYTPVEILYAAGFVPIRLHGGPGNAETVSRLIPDFICPYMRMTLERAMSGDYDFLSGIIQGYTCDAACGLTNIWEDNIGGELYHMIPLPYRDSPEARGFLRSAFEELIEKLRTADGFIDEQTLATAETLYVKIRESLQRLYRKGKEGTLSIPWGSLATVVAAGGLTPPEAYLQMLTELQSRLPEKPPAPNDHKHPVLVSGSLIEDPRILAAVEAAGGRIVGDDLCSGCRPLDPAAGTGASPLDRLIDRHFRRFPCPARSRAEERMPRLIDHCRQTGARAVLFLIPKFCSPHLADYPIAAAELRDAGIPCLLVELDETGQTGGQLQTRLESFFEMLDGSK